MNKNTSGHTKDEYFAISTKLKLQPRCPILRFCCRAIRTRYALGFDLCNSGVSFEQFIKSHNQFWEPGTMINEIGEFISTQKSNVFFDIENCCPEIPLFETQYLPSKFAQAAFCEATYYKESKTFEATAKHFSECAEYSEFISIQNLKKPRKRSPSSSMQRFEIFHRDNFTCVYCKRHKDVLPTGVILTLDHKIPYSDGGDDSQSNLVTACSDCNSGKSNKVVNHI